jgi:hypothetical protein
MDEVNWKDITIDSKYYNSNTTSFVIESNANILSCNNNFLLLIEYSIYFRIIKAYF